MELETWVILAIAGAPFVILAAVLIVYACRRSSQITRDEEKQAGKLL